MRLHYLVFAISVSVCAPASAQVTNHVAPGNLQARSDLGCLKAEALRNTYTAADLYRSDVDCVKQNDLESAVYVSALAGVYGRYESMRVADQSAHQAQTVLTLNFANALTDEQKAQFRAHLSAAASDPSGLTRLCGRIREVGPPDYHPTYMIQHGMGAFVGRQGNGLVPDFDGAAAWEKALDTYLHCPKT
ncbi:MAG: hypothetical protein QM639_09625 [Rhodocyclaceae bacterium]